MTWYQDPNGTIFQPNGGNAPSGPTPVTTNTNGIPGTGWFDGKLVQKH